MPGVQRPVTISIDPPTRAASAPTRTLRTGGAVRQGEDPPAPASPTFADFVPPAFQKNEPEPPTERADYDTFDAPAMDPPETFVAEEPFPDEEPPADEREDTQTPAPVSPPASKAPAMEPLFRFAPAQRLVPRGAFWAVAAVCVLAIALASGWPILTAEGPVVLGDELGYWGNAAVLAGRNWYDAMAVIPFYSYGYSLFLVPLFWLGLPMAVMYRVALGFNVLFLLAAFVLSYRCLRRLFGTLPPVGALLAAAATTLYTNTLVQAQAAWSETLLYLVYWVLVALVLRLLQKPTALTAVLLALAGGYLYMVHMRTMGVLIALGMTVLLFWAAKRLNWRQVLAFALAFAAMLALQNGIKSWMNAAVYTSANYAGANDYASQAGNMVAAFSSLNGLLSLFKSACGKLFYTASATLVLGLVTLRLLFADSFGALWQWVRSGFKRLDPCKLPSLFLLLSFGGTFAINVIAMRGGGRMDIPVYGRYMEFAFGPLIAIGLALLVLGRVGLGQAVGCCGVTALLAAVTNTVLIAEDAAGSMNYNFLCVTTWRMFNKLHPEVPQFTYYVAVVSMAVFLVMWAAQYAFGRAAAPDGQTAKIKIARPLLHLALPAVLAAGFWVWCASCDSSFTVGQKQISAAMAQVNVLTAQAGAAPQTIFWVQQEATDDVAPVHLQLRLPNTVLDSVSVTDFDTMALDPDALYAVSAASDATAVVQDRCVPLLTNSYFTLYAVQGSAWYNAAQRMVLLPGWLDKVPMYYDEAAVLGGDAKQVSRDDVKNGAAGADSVGINYREVTPAYAQREDGCWQTTLPVGITSNGQSGLVAYGPALDLPAGRYEISFSLTVAQSAGAQLGEFLLADGDGNRLLDATLSADQYTPGTPTRMTLTLTTMLDQTLRGAQFQLLAKAGVVMTMNDFTYTRVGEVGEVLTAGTAEMDRLGRLLELDYETLPVYVLPRESQIGRASVDELSAAYPGRSFRLVEDLSLLRTAPGILLVPTNRRSLIYELLGSYSIAEKLGDYTMLLPVGSGIESEFTGHGGALMSSGYSVDLRYYTDGEAQPAAAVTATPPAGTYYVVAVAGFDNTLTGDYGKMEITLDGASLGTVRLDQGTERETTFYSPYTLTLDGTQELAVSVSAGTNARLANLTVTLRWLGDKPATYGDAQG